MSQPQYLVRTTVAGINRSLFWSGEGELALDHEAPWKLCLDAQKALSLKDPAQQILPKEKFSVASEDLEEGVSFNLPPTETPKGVRNVAVNVRKVGSLTPAFLPLPKSGRRGVTLGKSVHYAHSGVHDFLLETRQIGKGFSGRIAKTRLFVFVRVENGIRLKSYSNHLVLELADGTSRKLAADVPEIIEDDLFEHCVLTFGNFWWRFTYVNQGPKLPGFQHRHSQEIPETIWFKRAAKSLFTFMLVTGLVATFSKSWIHRALQHAPPVQVTWKEPKYLPSPVVVQPIEKPPEPPKIAEKKPEPPKPEPIKKPPPRRLTAAPRKSAPVPAPRRPVAPVPAPAPVQAAAPPPVKEAPPDLGNSLNFLSDTKPKPSLAMATKSDGKRYATSLAKDATTKTSALRDRNPETKQDLDLRSSRDISSETKVKGKRLNDVAGRVALDANAARSARRNLSAALGSAQDLSVTGAGTISETDLKKALSKKLGKFQYCYEKALLSDPSLGGIITMQWVVSSAGHASAISVVNSQLPSATLESCLKNEIGKISFPQPKGGSVTVKYPFSFTKTS